VWAGTMVSFPESQYPLTKETIIAIHSRTKIFHYKEI
jgi:hypothetical protein